MIIEYEDKYQEEVKDLFTELQEYIVSLDKEKFNILTSSYRDLYFEKTIEEINNENGKMFLLKVEDKIVGLVVGIIMNSINEYDFKAPIRGRITELIVNKKYRDNGYGKVLLESMENYLKRVGCQNILIEVFGYNTNALNFYEKNGYHIRLYDVCKNIK